MTTLSSLPVTIPVTTPAGSRIPKVGTICCHPSLGFGSVISRTQSSVRIVLDDLEDADDVTLKDGTIVSRAAWLSRVSDASLNGACAEIAHLEARGRDDQDALYGARVQIKTLAASIEQRVRGADEMVVSIDGAEPCGWEFDEYAMEQPLKNIKKAKAPKPRAPKPVPAKVGTVEDPEMADWMVAEMNECFGEYWTPTAERKAELAPSPDYVPNV